MTIDYLYCPKRKCNPRINIKICIGRVCDRMMTCLMVAVEPKKIEGRKQKADK